MIHDKWSKMGEENLGGPDSPNITCLDWHGRTREEGAFTMMKCILNDYWADVPPGSDESYTLWDREKIDTVMSKIYYYWCVMLLEKHPPTENEELQSALAEDLEGGINETDA